MRRSATATALAGVAALLGASVVAASFLARRETVSSSATVASASSASSVRPATTTPALAVATTSVERRRPALGTAPTTTTAADAVSASTSTPPSPADAEPRSFPPKVRSGLFTPSVTAGEVWFATAGDGGAYCEERLVWRVPRTQPGSLVAITDDRRRLVELDPTSGAVLHPLAEWDDVAGVAVGPGVERVGKGSAPAVSRDGRTLAYVDRRVPRAWDLDCAPDIVLRDLASGAERVIPADEHGTELVTDLVWSPDGRVLAATLGYEGEWVAAIDVTDPATTVPAWSAESEFVPGRDWVGDSVDWLGDGRVVLSDWCCYGDDPSSAGSNHRGVLATFVPGPEATVVPIGEDEGARAVAVDPAGQDLAYVRWSGEANEVVLRRSLGPAVVIATGHTDVDW